MKDWKQEWEEYLIETISNDGIFCEKTSFSISSDLKKKRDWDWERIVQSGQVVDVVYPKRKNGKLKIKAFDADNLPIEIGSINYFDENHQYQKAIVGQLITKDLQYANGDTRNCLEFNQPIILINENYIPDEILNSDTFRLKMNGQREKKSTGCLGVLLVLLLPLIYYFI